LLFLNTQKNDIAWQGKWIWVKNETDCINQYADFRTVFSLDSVEPAMLYISADSSYHVWINGRCLQGNQFSDWPRLKTYNEFDITNLIKKGENVLAIKVHHIGTDFATYAKGRPGLIFQVHSGRNIAAYSDDKCLCRYCEAYKSGAMSSVSPQLGYNFEYDARQDDQWYKENYIPIGWSKAIILSDATGGFWKELSPRPLKMLEYKDPLDSVMFSSGKLLRNSSSRNIGQLMMDDFLSPFTLKKSSKGKNQNLHYKRPILSNGNLKPVILKSENSNTGVYAIFDLGAESAGLLYFDIEAPESTIIDIAHGEHLDDLRVRSFIDGRTFADRYICKQGRQQWKYAFRRLGGRYLEIHIPQLENQLKIYSFTLIPTEYPFDGTSCFYCVDEKLNQIWQISKRTLSLCAHEHYEDCPWREQALYAADSRLQALFGYYAFGEYDLPAACWNLIRKGYRKDGLLELVSPGKAEISIPGFSLQWIIAVYELFLFSGNEDVIQDNYELICEILLTSIQRLTDCGVVGNSTSPEYWNFYEWTPEFEGIEEGKYHGQNGRLDAAYNLYLLEALRYTIEISRVIGANNTDKFSQVYRKITDSFNNIFWNPQKKLYASFSGKGNLEHYSQLVQALAIREAIVPSEHIAQLCNAIKYNDNLTKAEISSKLVVYDSLFAASDENINFILDDVKTVFGDMYEKGATSFWETSQGSDAFEGAGSLCHGWSAVFNYIAGAFLLGIKPLKPGFAEFSVKPMVSYLSNANGVVKTVYGNIEICCTKTKNEFIVKLRYPNKLTPRFELPNNAKIIIDTF
jgi:hypothetical protein